MALSLNSKTLTQKLLKRGKRDTDAGTYSDIYDELGIALRKRTFSFSTFEKMFGREKVASEANLGILVAAIREQKDWGWDATFEEFLDYGQEKTKIPETASFITELKRNRFLMPIPRYEENGKAVIKWWDERSQFVAVDPPEHCPAGTLAFKGIQINNLTRQPFLLVAYRVGDFLFSVTGFHPQQQFSYHASFTKCFEVGKQKVLSGTWVGMDHTCSSSQYRCFLSNEAVSNETVESLTEEHKFTYDDGSAVVEWDSEEVMEFPEELTAAFDQEKSAPGTLVKAWEEITSTNFEN